MALTQAEADQRRTTTNGRISTKMRRVVSTIVFDGVDWRQACIQHDMSDLAFVRAIHKAPVVQYLRLQQKLFKTIASASNAAVSASIRADVQANPMTRLSAVRLLEDMDKDVPNASVAPSEQRFNINIINRLDRTTHTVGSASGPLIEQLPIQSNDIKDIAD